MILKKSGFLDIEEKSKIISKYMPTPRENEVIGEFESIIKQYRDSISKIENIKELEVTEDQLGEIMNSYKLTIRLHIEELRNLIYHLHTDRLW